MKKQVSRAVSPTPGSEPENGSGAMNVRRPARHYLYGPVSIGLRGDEENHAGMNGKPDEVVPVSEEEIVPQSEEVQSEEQIQPVPEIAQPADTRARQLVSGILETEKRNLPDWMSELLDPMDETAQLAFILKHRAEINATRRGRLAVPASPVTGNSAPGHTQIPHTQRRIYDTF